MNFWVRVREARRLSLGLSAGAGAVLFLSPTFAAQFASSPQSILALPAVPKIAEQGLSEVLRDRKMGLALESESVRKKLVQAAHEYARIESHGSRKERQAYAERCRQSTKINAYCFRFRDASAVAPWVEAKAEPIDPELSDLPPGFVPPDRSQLLDRVRAARWAELQGYTSGDFMWAVRKLKTSEEVMGIASSVLSQADCVPAGLLAALGSKSEEFLPDPSVRKTTVSLYERAAMCGKGETAIKASFRTALFSIYDGQVEQAEQRLKVLAERQDTDAYRARIRFWRLYCALKLKNSDIAVEMQNRIQQESPLSFHGLMGSQDGLAQEFLSKDRPDPHIRFRSVFESRANFAVQALEALIEIGATGAARDYIEVVSKEVSGAESQFKLYVATLYNRVGEGLESFKLLAPVFRQYPNYITSRSLELYFPRWQFDLLKSATARNKADPYLLLSLMRQESAFNTRARSQAGAMGLMQLLPATARSLARIRARDLYRPEVNIRVGTKFFSRLMDKYDGNVVYSLAAYNAGPGKVNEWMLRYPTTNPILFAELIPYRETREYVSNILRNYYWYTRLYTNKSRSERTASEERAPAAKSRSKKALSLARFDLIERLSRSSDLNFGTLSETLSTTPTEAP